MTDDARPEGVSSTPPPLTSLLAFLLSEQSLDEILDRVTQLAKEAVPGVDEVSVTLITEDQPRTAAQTGDLALTLDLFQYEQGYGPCMDAAQGATTVLIKDMRTDQRWPHWSPEAVSRGVRSSLSVSLPVQDQTIGALNLYAMRTDAFSPEAVEESRTFAGYAAIALANATLYANAAALAEQMRQAMASRAVIEQAKGILMSQRRCSADEAFQILSALSQSTNRKLRDVALTLVQGVAPQV